MPTYIVSVYVDSEPERIVHFGINLANFSNKYPDISYSWSEAEYDQEDGDEEEDGCLTFPDNITVFERDFDRTEFLIRFDTSRDRDLYLAFRDNAK